MKLKGTPAELIDSLGRKIENLHLKQAITEIEIVWDYNNAGFTDINPLIGLMKQLPHLYKIVFAEPSNPAQANADQHIVARHFITIIATQFNQLKTLRRFDIGHVQLTEIELVMLNGLFPESTKPLIQDPEHPDQDTPSPHFSKLSYITLAPEINLSNYPNLQRLTKNSRQRFLKIIASFLSKVAGTIVGPVLGILSALFIHNPVTCFLGALDYSHWQRYGIIKNLFRIIISPVVFPVIALLDHIKDGAKVGYKHGLVQALQVPYKAWQHAPYYTSEILLPWLITGIVGSVIGMPVGLAALGLIAKVPAFVSTILTAELNASTIALFWQGIIISYAIASYEIVQYFLYNAEFFESRTQTFRPYYAEDQPNQNSTILPPTLEVSNSPYSKNSTVNNDSKNSSARMKLLKTPTKWGDFFALPPDLSASNEHHASSRSSSLKCAPW